MKIFNTLDIETISLKFLDNLQIPIAITYGSDCSRSIAASEASNDEDVIDNGISNCFATKITNPPSEASGGWLRHPMGRSNRGKKSEHIFIIDLDKLNLTINNCFATIK
jgi:hypothetical protein